MRMTWLVVALLFGSFNVAAQAESQWIYIASSGKAPVIARATLDTETGEFEPLEVAVEDVKTGFMALHPAKNKLYAGTSEKVAKGMPNGAVRAYDINIKTGALKETSHAGTEDNGTTHIQVSPKGNAVAVCHYGGDGTSLIPLQANGDLIQRVSKLKHYGSSVNEKRQTAPHPHGVAFSPNGNYLMVADLGNDHVEVFSVNKKRELREHSYWSATPGAGPRHVTLHPSRPIIYCINELDSTISVLKFDPIAGLLTEVQTISTLPEDFTGNNTTAEVVVDPTGQFVYGSNRGHDSTAVFKIDSESEKLSFVQREPTGGEHPRFVGMDPTGQIYVTANMFTGNLVSFHVDQKTGELKPTGNELKVDRPMCVLFVKR